MLTPIGISFMQITSLGFQFLLHSPHAQLWELLLQYLHMAEVWMYVKIDRRLKLIINVGASDGSDRSTGFLIHAIDYGAWSGQHWIFLYALFDVDSAMLRPIRLRISERHRRQC